MMLNVLIAWYVFCALVISMVVMTMRSLTHSKFRDDDGDKTTEIGYEEDPEGHDLKEHEYTNFNVRERHAGITPRSR